MIYEALYGNDALKAQQKLRLNIEEGSLTLARIYKVTNENKALAAVCFSRHFH